MKTDIKPNNFGKIKLSLKFTYQFNIKTITIMKPSYNFSYSSKEEIIKTLSGVLSWIDDTQQTVGDLKESLGIIEEDEQCPTQEGYKEVEKLYFDIKLRGQDPDRSQISSVLKHYYKAICGRIWELEDQAEAALN